MIDRARIANEIGLSPESVDYILNLFFKETCRRIKVVNDLTSRHAYGEARAMIHQLLGSCAYCRFEALESALDELNIAIKTQQNLIPKRIQQVNSLYAMLEKEHESIR